MISNFQRFNEAVALTGSLSNITYYHGCGKEELAQQIIQDGVIKPGRTKESRISLAPIAGKVYVTPVLSYALIYAIGGGIGEDDPRYRKIEKQYGYVAAFNGSRLNHVLPDEDIVGALLQCVINDKFYLEFCSPEERHIYQAVSDWSRYEKERLLSLAKWKLTDRQLHSAKYAPEYHIQSAIGKKLIKFMDDALIQQFVATGCALANEGSIVYDTLYRIDKRLKKELKRDGSNFLDLAEVVGDNKKPEVVAPVVVPIPEPTPVTKRPTRKELKSRQLSIDF